MATKKEPQERPKIEGIKSGKELRQWYWLKTELVAEARRIGIKCSGAKFDVLDRICHFRDTGEVEPAESHRAAKAKSSFDWHAAPLTLNTRITSSYKNTQNVRRFFKANADPRFKFNIALMDWMKSNEGKTLREAIAFWKQQNASPEKTKIKPHNQFNQYLRDFAEDNPTLNGATARKAWAEKKKRPSPSGRHVYEPGDLELVKPKRRSK